MSDELLPYYNRELAFIRRLGAEFAAANPKIAGRLRISADSVEDPHVSRLVEAFAYLSARIRHKLDDDFPEISDALMGVLYPHYLAPVPSMAIVQFEPQADLTSAHTIARGTSIETQPVNNEPCRFRTCYPVTVWPVSVTEASLAGRHAGAPQTPRAAKAAAVLHIGLRCAGEGVSFADLAPDSLRFHLRGQGQHVYDLYELLLNDAAEIAVVTGRGDAAPLVLGADALKPVGFGRDEGMLPYPAQSFLGYRLLTEFFAFPDKFLFVDLDGLAAKAAEQTGQTLDLYVYLNRTSSNLERAVERETFALGCSPVVNLFTHRAEPVQLSHTVTEYRVVPDARRPGAMEVYTVDRVAGISPEGDQREFVPFYGTHHAAEESARKTYWYASRRPAGPRDPATEVYLALVDLGFRPTAPANWTLDVQTTCLNRDLPNRLPFGGGEPRLRLSAGETAIGRITCLTRPTPTYRPPLRHGAMWRLLSHLSLNHLSLTGGEDGTRALQEIIKLYDFTDSEETRTLIAGLASVTSRRVASRIAGAGAGGVGHGLEVSIELDPDHFAGSGLFLFASVLERFLALYCSINSFVRLVATVKGRSGVLRRWPPRAGEHAVL